MQGGWGGMGGGAWGGAPKPPADDEEEGLPPSKAPVFGANSTSTPMPAPTFGANSFKQPNPLASGPGSTPTGAFSGAFNPQSSSASASGLSAADLKRKEAELNKREADLKRREAELEASGGGKKKNWPVCFPVYYHNIEDEVPEKSRRVVREMYLCWWGLLLCLSFQIFCSSIMLGYDAKNKIPSWFLSIIYWLCGVPLSFILWYKRIYNAAKDDSSIGYALFFLFFACHIAFCIWAAIAVPFSTETWSFSGWVAAFQALSVSKFAGVCYIIGASLWSVESAWCLWCLKDSFLYFRGKGGVKQAQQGERLRLPAPYTCMHFRPAYTPHLSA